ncbi:MAG: hypothetical protein J6A87_03445 [Clostridia bacterium]|nr:hypothetical protein [Clostridia bacterium]
MDTKAKKNLIKLGFTTLITAAILGGASLMPDFKAQRAHAAQSAPLTPSANSQQDTLITPTTYEQYLPLNAPTDVAVCDDFTAIADGSKIYVYNDFYDLYRVYEHTANATADLNTVANLEFSSAGDLYFIDGNAHMYAIENDILASMDGTITTKADFPTFFCNAFVIDGNDLYFAVSSESSAHLSRTSLFSPNASTAEPIVSNVSKGPSIAYSDGVLYYTDASGYYLKKIALEEDAFPYEICAFPQPITSVAVNGDEIYVSNDRNNFYVYDRITLTGLASQIDPLYKDETGGYKSLSVFEENVYAIRERSVRQYAVGVGFTDFEISADSSAPHRLKGATNATLVGDKLYVTDSGNSRISVYNGATKGYYTVSTPEPAHLIAAYENTLLAANDGAAWLIDVTDPSAPITHTFKGFQGNLTGVTAVHGKYYLVTATNFYYSIEYAPLPVEEGEPELGSAWQLKGGIKKSNTIAPRLLSSDVYGNVYVVAGNDVHKLPEQDIFLADAYGEEILTMLPANPEQLLVDLNENVYVLKAGTAHRYTYDTASNSYSATADEISLASQMVYGQTDATPVQAFAFDVLENAAYLLYNGNFVVKTTRLSLPTVQTVATAQIEDRIFSSGAAEFKVVETSKDAFLISFDLENLSKLQGSENACFPYLSHGREPSAKTALLLGQAGEYSVLAIFNKDTHKYGNYLTKTRYFVTEKDESEYLVEYTEEGQKTGYLTNALSLYKYPYLTQLLTVTGLTKNQAVTLLGEVNDLDYSYYKIRFTDGDGNEQTGFIPKTYATLFDGEPKPTERTEHGSAHPNEDSLWRLTFLLLGAAAICILLDLLILHHRPKDE